MKSSLIPDKPILVYPSLAATVGLEESILLSIISDISQHKTPEWRADFAWYNLPCEAISDALPFWGAHDIQRICQSLRDKGILLIGATLFGQDTYFRVAFNEKVSHTAKTNVPATAAAPAAITPNPAQPKTTFSQTGTTTQQSIFGKNFIAPNWQPDADTLSQLHQHAIPSAFAIQQVPAFVTYWRERNEAQRSWGSIFIKHIIHQWRKFEAQQHLRSQEIHMHPGWRPSEDALQVLTEQSHVNREFIEDAVPEFILFWQERGDKLSTWNSKFIQHIKLQWHKYTSSLESSSQPRSMQSHWQPSEEVYDVLRLANIDLSFAKNLIAEFVMYWRDSGQVHTSWNTRFLQYTKKQWAKRHALNTNGENGTDSPRSTREISLEEELGDRSWAS